MRALLSLAVAAVLVAFSTAALADKTDDDAKVQWQQGIALFNEGEMEQAAILFRKAYELKPSYKILWNLAQAESELRHYAAALAAYKRYLADGGSEVPADRIVATEEEIKRLNALVGSIDVQDTPDGAAVIVDKEERGRSPLPAPVFVEIGKHEVRVEHQGHVLLERVVTVAGGDQVALKVESTLADAMPPPQAAEPEAPPPGTQVAAPEPAAPSEPAPERKKSPLMAWGWGTAGIGAALLVAGGVTGGVAMSKDGELADACPGATCADESDLDLEKSRDALALATDVLLPAGGAFLVTGAVLLIVGWKRSSGGAEQLADATRFLPYAGDGGAGLIIEGRF